MRCTTLLDAMPQAFFSSLEKKYSVFMFEIHLAQQFKTKTEKREKSSREITYIHSKMCVMDFVPQDVNTWFIHCQQTTHWIRTYRISSAFILFQVEKKLMLHHIVRHFTVHTWTMLSQNVIVVDVLFPYFSFHSMAQVPLDMLPLLVSVSPKSPFWKVDFCFNAQVVRLFFHRMYALHWHLSTLLDVYARFFPSRV